MKNKNFDNKVKKTLKKTLKSSIAPDLKKYLKNFTTGQNCLKRMISLKKIYHSVVRYTSVIYKIYCVFSP